ncbi:MAG: RNA polymerase sigma factor, partial [Planctomycetota bacterium]
RTWELPSDEEGPFVAATQGEMAKVLAREMAALSPEKREILYLRHFEELPYRKIAEILDIPEGTVMSRLFAARAALRARMEKYL